MIQPYGIRKFSFPFPVLLILMLFVACGRERSDLGVTPLGTSETSEINVSESKQKERIRMISRGVAQKGLNSGLLIAGIAAAEGNLAHCWSEATWACKGPASISCNNGPVIAGAFDGPCSMKQGGLGMFQFDSGTHDQTLREYGSPILNVEGNAAAVIPFLLKKVKYFPNVAKRYGAGDVHDEKSLAEWIDSISPSSGKRYTDWLAFVSCLYNGACGGEKVAAYDASTRNLLALHGNDFFIGNGIGPDPVNVIEDSNPQPLEECQRILVSRTNGDRINVRSNHTSGQVLTKVSEGQQFDVLDVFEDGDFVDDPFYPTHSSRYWVMIDSQPAGWISAVYAMCQEV